MNQGPDTKRWREALRRLGLPAVRSKLQRSDTERSPEVELHGVVDEHPHPSGGFVNAWYRDAVRRAQRHRSLRMQILASVAVLAILAGILGLIFLGG